MDEERKSNLLDAAGWGLSIAHAARGAAKGMAAGGPAGAVAGALWGGRGTAAKALAAASALVLLPVLFLMLLPGVIFGGFGGAYSSHDLDAPVLNSEMAIMETASELTATVNAALAGGLEDARARIQREFSLSGAVGMEIVEPSGIQQGDVSRFIAQYCAAKEANFAGISVSVLANILRREKGKLYAYQRREEWRERIETDSETGEEAVYMDRWLIYTIAYNGEDYFADEIFHLTDAQKTLAGLYAQNLSLFLGDGLLQNAGSTQSIPALGDMRFTDAVTELVYYNQRDERYAGKPYGTNDIGSCGCGPTCMAMVVSSLTGQTADPVKMACWSYDNGYWIKDGGSYQALIPAAAAHWGLPVSGCGRSEPQRILDALAAGKLVVAIMGAGHFTDSGHFILLRGVKDGQIMVADPYSVNYSNRLWDLSLILNEASSIVAAGGPFWIVG